MTIQFASDLHLELLENRQYILEHPLQAKADVLLLAGDIVSFSKMDKVDFFFDAISAQFKEVWWIPGNHEYYFSDAKGQCDVLEKAIRHNVHLVNNKTILYPNVRIIASTLWSEIKPENEMLIQASLSDYHVIEYGERLLTVHDTNSMHSRNRSFIVDELFKPFEGHTVVFTHHVPTMIHYPERYKTSKINNAFVSDLTSLIESSSIDYWIYGHHHVSVQDFKVGTTMLCTNQLGYVRQVENIDFRLDRTIKLC